MQAYHAETKDPSGARQRRFRTDQRLDGLDIASLELLGTSRLHIDRAARAMLATPQA
jgi:hypothetical protein